MKFEKIKDVEELKSLGVDPDILEYTATINDMIRSGLKVTLRNGKSFYLHKILKSNLDTLKRAITKKWDGIILSDGMEGSGKTSTTAGACAYLSEGKFTLNDVLYTPKQIEEWIDKAEPGSVGMIDEFALVGLSSEYMGKIQRTIIKRFTTMRSKRLTLFIVLPSIWLLAKYFAIGRTRCLLHSYSPNGIERGFFKFYSYNEKKTLYLKGKKNWDSDTIKPAFKGYSLDNLRGLFWDEDDYESRKQKYTKEALEEQDRDTMREAVIKAIKDLHKIGVRCKECKIRSKLTYKEIAYLFGYSDRHIHRLIEVEKDPF